METYANRQEAGILLAEHLTEFTRQPDTLILALPRGGVPVAYEVATRLSLPLDVFIVRKLGVPDFQEFAMGAIASGNTLILNKKIIRELSIEHDLIDEVRRKEQEELARRELLYRGDRPFPSLQEKTIILIDDGIATGSTMLAAIKAVKKHKPKALIIAVPVAALSTCQSLEKKVDQVICPLRPIDFYAVGYWYDSFPQVEDAEVIALLGSRE
ncbi:MAG: phosphoribosyltransferase [Legionella sp.]|nr:MAG: phosphoribosyltransferase [Legionella sp.]